MHMLEWQNGFSYFTSTGSILWFKSRGKNTQSIFKRCRLPWWAVTQYFSSSYPASLVSVCINNRTNCYKSLASISCCPVNCVGLLHLQILLEDVQRIAKVRINMPQSSLLSLFRDLEWTRHDSNKRQTKGFPGSALQVNWFSLYSLDLLNKWCSGKRQN